MALDSNSSLQDVQASYMDNASYLECNDADKARAFVTACRMLLILLPRETSRMNGRIVLSPDLVQREMHTAIQWLQLNAQAGQPGGPAPVILPSFRHCRGRSWY